MQERIEDFMLTLPVWLQPWFALLYFACIGVVFIFTLAIVVYGIGGITWWPPT